MPMEEALTLINDHAPEPAPDQRPTNKSDPRQILSAWSALELLSPKAFVSARDLVPSGDKELLRFFDTEKLPWEGEGEVVPDKKVLYYHLILGKIDFYTAKNELIKVYCDDPEPDNSKGNLVLGAIVLDRKGVLATDQSAGTSSFGWALRRALDGDLESLGDWMILENLFKENLIKFIKTQASPLNKEAIGNIYNYLVQIIDIPQKYVSPTNFAIKHLEDESKNEAPMPLSFNSLFISDLAKAADLFKHNQPTKNMQKYLSGSLAEERYNILDEKILLEDTLSPQFIPTARWPSKGGYSLVLLQQAAVNIALNNLNDSSILAVNGPPGTGKTTLLKDIIAGIVANRAKVMASFNRPKDAFSKETYRMGAGERDLDLYKLDNKLKGFEMVIASSNNKAVENISMELPVINAIAEDIKDFKYFTTISDNLLNRKTWGLISASLGNLKKRSEFCTGFWTHSDFGLKTYLKNIQGKINKIHTRDEKGKILSSRLPRIVTDNHPPENSHLANKDWTRARLDFENILKKCERKIQDLQDIREAILNIPPLDQTYREYGDNYRDFKLEQSRALDSQGKLQASFDDTLRSLDEIEDLITEKESEKPNILMRIFRMKKFLMWQAKKQQLLDQRQIILSNKNLKETELNSSKTDCEEIYLKIQKCDSEKKKIHEQLNILREIIAHFKDNFEKYMLDKDFFWQPQAKVQKTSPWCHDEIQKLRDEVFISAIKLHKAFVDAAAEPFAANLEIFVRILSTSKYNVTKNSQLIAELWTTFFMVVPSISTTFSSVEKMLGGLPLESLGWLLIDEAGQAVPQAAVGAIMRTKHAVIVGDPIQIEPVVALPGKLTKSICERFYVDPSIYNAPSASAQSLADAASPFYYEFKGNNSSRKVGLPLLVHRRCDEPMFTISNVIAYEGLMINDKKSSSSPIRDCLGPSFWFDVKGSSVDKGCYKEGEKIVELLIKLKNAAVKPDIYIISPFTNVVYGIKAAIRNNEILKSWTIASNEWLEERVGTIHTVQGREAEAIFFVLGAQGADYAKSRRWASKSPNLLNVAVTRAQEALYVIGNEEEWKKAGAFRELYAYI